MNKSVHRISLDIHDTASQSSINAKKGDTARSIYITLQENGKPYRIAEGCHAVFTGVKADGNYLFNDCTIKDNVIIYDFTEQTVPVVGQVHCEVALYDANNERITSPRFDIIVNDVVYNDEEIVSSDEANALISATAEAKAITAEVEQKLANGDFVGEKGEPGKDADPQLFANAVIGSAEGEAVRVNDVSPVEHLLNVKVDHDNPTSVTVTRCGKNHMPYPYHYKDDTVTGNGVTFTSHKDGTITVNGTATDTTIYYLHHSDKKIKIRKGEKYHLSGCPSGGDGSTYMLQGTDGSTYQTDFGKGFSFTAAKEEYYFYIVVYSGTTLTDVVFKPQLELGSTATAYESYIKPTTYTPNADGTVEGITSLSPTMTLLTDTDGAVIHCEYNRDTNKALSVTKDGTVVSPNADFAEVAEWADGNPNNEDRTGYFVCANIPVDGIVMKKATSIDDVKGVSILAPAFAGNYTKDKVDENGNLLPKYSYVAIIGFVPVRDNGTCTVGGRCMPDDNGCAIPSSNSMGYQVVNRIDENRVLIIIEPNGDMVQRIKTRVNKLQEDIDNLAPDQTFDPTSLNAQSGIAVEERLKSKVLLDATLTEEQAGASSVMLEIPDWQLLKKAKQWNFFLSHPYSGAYATGAINYRADIRDKNSVSYCFPIGFESNNAYLADYNIATWHTVTFNLCFDDGLGEIMTIQNKPTCWSRISAYNTLNNARVTSSSRGINDIMSEIYPPYLEVKNSSNFIFEAGTRLYLEVIL